MINTFADEDRLAFSIGFPLALRRASEMAVDSMEHVTLLDALHIKDTLHSVHLFGIPLPDGAVRPQRIPLLDPASLIKIEIDGKMYKENKDPHSVMKDDHDGNLHATSRRFPFFNL